MGKIHILSELVANRIAAGEVVERPASVVKELVENALDAGALELTVRVEEGGSRLMEVSDNGCGLEPGDARLAFERHATSKIRNADDIANIGSFGFRGEALPSIAAVAEVEMLTSAGGGEAARIVLRGGEVTVEEIGHRTTGTTVSVRNLFFNTPARRKFMKSEQSEERQIRRAVIAHALAREGVSFRYITNDKEIFHLPAGKDLKLRAERLFGEDLAGGLVRVEGSERGPHVSGLVGGIESARGNRFHQFFHVNGRPVQQTLLTQAASAPFRGSLPPRRYPVFILGLTIDPEFVDVNIHPTKREVRFSPERTVFAAVEGVVRRALSSEASIPSFWSAGAGHSRTPSPGSGAGIALPLGREEEWKYHASTEAGEGETPRDGTEPGVDGWLGRVNLSRVIQVGGVYLVAGGTDGMVVVDQHTAHERILFEEILRRIEGRGGDSQSLLFPETMGVDPLLVSVVEEFEGPIERSGFRVRPSGPRSLLLEGIPAGLRKGDPGALLVHFLEYLEKEGKSEESHDRRVAASIACHGAVRAGDTLLPEECRSLLLRLTRCEQPLRCPHGRPTFLVLTPEELAKRFLR